LVDSVSITIRIALKYIEHNANGVLAFSETEIPSLERDECLIAVKAIGVNRADILQREGKYPPPKGESLILGIEICGEIVSSGQQVSQWRKGDKVFGLVPGGGYAQFVKAKASHLIQLPEQLTFEQGAAIAEGFLTAFQSLNTIANLKPFQNVLIHAGASGVGTAAIQLAKQNNCYVVTTVSSEEKQKACIALGADKALNYHLEDFQSWSKEHKKQFDVIIDVVAGDYLAKNINVAAIDGHIVLLSILGGRFAENVDVAKMLLKRITLHATTLRNRDNLYKQALVDSFVQCYSVELSENKITPVIDSIFSWKNVEQAHQKLMNNENIGKVILTVN